MSEIALTIIKVLFLGLLWLFIASAVSVIKSDLFGRTGSSPDQRQQLEPAPRPAKRTRRPRGEPRKLTIVQGSQAGMSSQLDGVVTVGRGTDCQLVLDDDYVSTRHARVASTPDGGYYIEDLASTNGTYVNGQRITAPTVITLQDSVRIGKTQLRLEP